jgi:hypothetical protein
MSSGILGDPLCSHALPQLFPASRISHRSGMLSGTGSTGVRLASCCHVNVWGSSVAQSPAQGVTLEHGHSPSEHASPGLELCGEWCRGPRVSLHSQRPLTWAGKVCRTLLKRQFSCPHHPPTMSHLGSSRAPAPGHMAPNIGVLLAAWGQGVWPVLRHRGQRLA